MTAIQSTEAKVWDAHAELAIGALIRRYLADHPPLEDSAVAPHFERWASELQDDGRERLGELGARHLYAVSVGEVL